MTIFRAWAQLMHLADRAIAVRLEHFNPSFGSLVRHNACFQDPTAFASQ
jgi:hypothetical protein